MSFHLTLKKLPRNATIRRIFRYSLAKNYQVDSNNQINYYMAQKLLEKCPYCKINEFNSEKYYKCRPRSCNQKWVIAGPTKEQYYGSIFTFKGPYWKAIAEILKRRQFFLFDIEKQKD